MSEFTDDTIGRYLAQQPGMREALLADPVQNMQAEALRQTLSTVERALMDEGVPDDVRRRVINRVVWGEPEGSVDVHARMRRERELLLTTFEPSASECTINQPFTEPGPGAAQLTDGTPEQLAAWVEKEQARLIESTGFDLRVPSEGDDGPERPVSG